MVGGIYQMRRTDYCGNITPEQIGQKVTVCGWVQRQRDLGGLIFIDLRDRTGLVQLQFDESVNKEAFDVAFGVRSEYVLEVTGTVAKRGGAVNENLKTGMLEILADTVKVWSRAKTPPFEIVENSNVNEELRLKYRFLDLRRPDLQGNILMRHRITKITRDYFDENGFIEIETPMLMKSTPEGARDYLVPSRIHPGSFYALPQSPQIYKQLSMVAGFDRYMQIARCFRDEDLRADRQPEFTQIDLEMSFVEMEDVLGMVEGFMERVFREALGEEVKLPLPRLTYQEAMDRYGSDKPDTRFGMELFDISDIAKNCGFGVCSGAIEAGGSVRGITAEGGAATLTRKEIDKLTEHARGIGAKGLAFIRWMPEGINCSFGKFLSEEEMKAILERSGAKEGDVVLFVADAKKSIVLNTLGALRLLVADKLGVKKEGYNLLWITEFPFFEWDEDNQCWVAMHHPFTSPMDECLQYLETDKAKVRAKAYDLVLNGVELASGSIRITDPELQGRMFNMLGLSPEEAHQKFGFLTDAFQYGAPPHGGLGMGLDRLVMQLLGLKNLRDVVAYPKVQNASELMSSCPSEVSPEQLKELGIAIIPREEN
ncbi:MAG: aspartate--tRNA ligase [Clostridia bacterium]|nr:aspartate--tRNA ligase [Clostridia bacterium]